jgi:hypothetical protein
MQEEETCYSLPSCLPTYTVHALMIDEVQAVTSSRSLLQNQITSYNGSVGEAMDSFVAIIMPKERVSRPLFIRTGLFIM